MLRSTSRQSWEALQAHRKDIGQRHLCALVSADAARGGCLAGEGSGIRLDDSKNRVTAEIITLRCRLADESESGASSSEIVLGARVCADHLTLETFGTLALTKEGSRNALIRRHRMQEEGGR